MRNQVCPYTTKPVSEIRASREHIVPDALGGPEAFALRACEAKNSDYGSTVDSRLIHSPNVSFLTMSLGIKTRSGPARMRTRGELLSDGAPVDIVFSKNSIDTRLRTPVVKDADTGEIVGVRGFGDNAKKEFDAIQKRLRRKGREVTYTRSEPMDSRVKGRLTYDRIDVMQGLGKIAYLMTAWTLGDKFIDCQNASQYRQWIEAKPTEADLDATELRVLPAQAVIQIQRVLEHPSLDASRKHILTCSLASGRTVSTVRLFGSPLLAFGAVIDVPDLAPAPPNVRIVKIDPVAKDFDELQMQELP